MTSFKWFESYGGPLLLIEREALVQWSGILNRSAYLAGLEQPVEDYLNPDLSDYGAACATIEAIDVLQKGKSSVLVLGDEPLTTTLLQLSAKEMIIIRWEYGEDGDEYHLSQVRWADLEWKAVLEVYFPSGKLYLTDATNNGRLVMSEDGKTEVLAANLQPGIYQVYEAIIQPNSHSKFLAYRLTFTGLQPTSAF